jgi:hypothetical protein
MPRRNFRFLLPICCLLTTLAAGQASEGPRQQSGAKPPSARDGVVQQDKLHIARVRTITSPAEVADSFVSHNVCDGSDNLYVQKEPRDAVRKFNAKGELAALFQAAANTDKKIDATGYFTLAPNGDLYQLVYPHEFDRYVYVYKSDGAFKSAIKLNPGFVWFPHTLAVFGSGQLLIAGSEYDKDKTAAMWPFTGIFAADGSLFKEIKLEDDDTLHDMAALGDARVASPRSPQLNRAVEFSQAEMAADGNAYLMRWTNPAIIYAISPRGEVLRRLKIDPGDPGYQPSTMHVFQNRIAVLFVDAKSDFLMKIVDLEGHDLARYDEVEANRRQPGAMLGSSLACYTEDPTRFVFLGANDENRLQFWVGEPR